MTKKTVNYTQAIEELNKILEGLDSETIDVDEVASQVRRAVELIKICRAKIEGTELEVRKIVKEFEKDTEGTQS